MSGVSRAGVSQSLKWGEIDNYILLALGNGDIAGTFDPFGGTAYDELRHGSGGERDIRTLLQSRLFSQDYWEFEAHDPALHFFDQRYCPPTPEFMPREAVRGAPVEIEVRPDSPGFPQGLAGHKQELDIERGILSTDYECDGRHYHLETFIHPERSLVVYRIIAGGPMRLCLRGTAGRSPKKLIPDPDRRGRRPENDQGKWRGVWEDGAWLVEVLSNYFCPAAAALWADHGVPDGEGFVLPAGESTVVVAIGHQSLRPAGQPREQAIREQALGEVRWASRAGYAALRAEQESWWRSFWERSWVELPDARLEGMWHRSMYYLAAAVPRRIATIPYEGFPGCFPTFHANGVQDAMYHLLALISSGHAELARGEMEALLIGLPASQAVARTVYFLEGARYPWFSGEALLPYLMGHSSYNGCLHEHHVNGWVSEAVRRYLEAVGWRQDLTQRYYPIIAEIARFFAATLTERDGLLNIQYVPSSSQEETGRDYDQPNIFDMLVAARRSLENAAMAAGHLGVDDADARGWADQARRLSLRWTQGADKIYHNYEGDTGHQEKCPAQLVGLVAAPYLLEDPEGCQATYSYLRQTVDVGMCSWTPGYYAIAAARMCDGGDAMRCLEEAFRFSQPPWIMFRENVKQLPGNMPYYLAAHALFVQSINEMLLQDWSGEARVFPACPFEHAAFRLQAGSLTVEGRK
jgi:hypothetical protein